MIVEETNLPGVKIIHPDYHRDARGYFVETYNAARYRAAGIDATFVQDNRSFSQKGVLRGLHWQSGEHAQAKLVSVIQGAVYDVAVDLRRDSPTFGKWAAAVLSGENGLQFYIPRHFAHGFLVLEDNTLFSYKCDNVYAPEAERGLKFNDVALAIDWPPIGGDYLLSAKDMKHPTWTEWLNKGEEI